jgi:hypothetical protein
MVLNDRLFLEDTGLAELGPRRISAMDEAGINVIRDGLRHLQPCLCRILRPRQTNWNVQFGKMASWDA